MSRNKRNKRIRQHARNAGVSYQKAQQQLEDGQKRADEVVVEMFTDDGRLARGCLRKQTLLVMAQSDAYRVMVPANMAKGATNPPIRVAELEVSRDPALTNGEWRQVTPDEAVALFAARLGSTELTIWRDGKVVGKVRQ